MAPYESVYYAFTITLRPKLYVHPPEEQYDMTYKHVTDILDSMSRTFVLIAEKTKSFNVHFHGCIKYWHRSKDHMKDFHDAFRNDKFVGFIKINQITDLEGWKVYLLKDLVGTKNALDRRPIIKCIENFFEKSETLRAEYSMEW